MEFLIVRCPRCPTTFYTANDCAEHHLLAHERLTRRDGTLLVAITGDEVIGYTNGTRPDGGSAEIAPRGGRETA